MKTIIVLNDPDIKMFVIVSICLRSVYSNNELIAENKEVPLTYHSYCGGEMKIIAHCEPSEIDVFVLTDKWRAIKYSTVSYTMELLP